MYFMTSKIPLLENKIDTLKNKYIMRMWLGKTNNSHISMFHGIVKTNDEKYDPFCCTVEELVKYIDYCKQNNIEICSIKRLLEADKNIAVKKHAVITFDDIYDNVYKFAFPILLSLNIPFMVFISTSLLDTPGYISSNNLIKMNESELCTVGMHNHQHIKWRFESDKRFLEDIKDCKNKLYEILGSIPRYYAFPYGTKLAISNRQIELAKNIDYIKCIFTTEQMKIRITDFQLDTPVLPRLDVPGYFNGRYQANDIGLFY